MFERSHEENSLDLTPAGDWRSAVAAALEQLEGGDVEGACTGLRGLLDRGSLADAAGVAAELAIEDDELDQAFAEAESERVSMLDATQVAHQAMRAAALDAPEGLGADLVLPESLTSVDGDESTERDPATSQSSQTSQDGDLISTLEGWLGNLNRRVA